MSLSHEALISLLAGRHQLYVQLGLIESHVVASQARSILGVPFEDSAAMRDLAERVESQIGEIDRRLSHFNGPIRGEAEPAAGPASPLAPNPVEATIRHREGFSVLNSD